MLYLVILLELYQILKKFLSYEGAATIPEEKEKVLSQVMFSLCCV